MTDTPLTDDGVLEAKTAGKLIGNEDIKFDAVYTSLLRRSIKTVWMVLQEIGKLFFLLSFFLIVTKNVFPLFIKFNIFVIYFCFWINFFLILSVCRAFPCLEYLYYIFICLFHHHAIYYFLR